MHIIEPVGYEEEELVTINDDPGATCVTVSGYANFSERSRFLPAFR